MQSGQETVTPESVGDNFGIDLSETQRARIGFRLGEIRQSRNMPQDEAAKRIGISRSHLSNIEVGRSRPGWSRLMAMATVYDVAIDTLIREVSVPGDDTVPLVRPPRRRVERPKSQPAEGSRSVTLQGRITAQSKAQSSAVMTTIVGAAFSAWEVYVIEGLAKLPAQEKRAIFAELMEKIRATLET